MIENSPTRIRGSIQAIQGLALLVFIIPIIPIQSFFIESMANIHQTLMLFGIPSTIVSAFVVWVKLKETVHVDITKIEG